MRIAALDLGTNTFICLIAEVEAGDVTRIICDEVRVVRLGQALQQTRRFHPEALKRAEDCFSEFRTLIQKNAVQKTVAVATSAARDAENGRDLIELGLRYGIPIDVIDGEREAELTYRGTVAESSNEPVLIIDIGGGSTEFILGDHRGLVAKQSLDIGSVRLTEACIKRHPIDTSDLARLEKAIQAALKTLKIRLPSGSGKMIAVAGTPTTLAAVELGRSFDPNLIDGHILTLENLKVWIHRLAAMTVEERQALPGMEPKRADVIVAGATILKLACLFFSIEQIQVSIRGLRYGLAMFAGRK